MRSFKLAVGLVLLTLLVIFAIQNAQELEVEFLVWRFSMRRALVLFVVLAIGVVLGWVLRGRPRAQDAKERATETIETAR